jgi:hypothetical protein
MSVPALNYHATIANFLIFECGLHLPIYIYNRWRETRGALFIARAGNLPRLFSP